MTTTVGDPLVGRVLDDRYLVESRLARGGMGTVYLALDRRLDRRVALKVMHPHLADHEQFVGRFVREARSAARLSHPNVVQVFDQGDDHGTVYLAMEYLPGRTLRDLLNERGALSVGETSQVLEPVLSALAAAHAVDLVHRDVKPENVLLSDDGRIKVADFGLAKAASAASTTTTVMGTVAYLAPEVLTGDPTDLRSDVYALGVMLFELLTGALPFTGDVPMRIAYRHVHEDVPPPSELAEHVPAALDRVVLAATARDPGRRPADAGQLLGMLRSARETLPASVLHRHPARRSVPPPPRTTGTGSPAGARRAAPVHLPPETATQPVSPDPTRLMTAAPVDPYGQPYLAGRPAYQHPVFTTGQRVMAGRHRRGVLLGALAVLVAAAAAAGGWLTTAGPPNGTPVPQVEGLSQQAAATALHDAGLKERVNIVFDDDTRPGLVAGTEPGPGHRVSPDSTVILDISKGPEEVQVPDLNGLKQAEAETRLRQVGLRLGNVRPEYEEDVPAGQIYAQDPDAGDDADNGSGVEVRISLGTKPEDVPDVEGRSIEDATEALEDRGFVVRVAKKKAYDNDSSPGQVASQSPAGNTKLVPGKSVTLTESLGPKLDKVPDVTGETVARAEALLRRAGFVPRSFGTELLDRVVTQRPAGGIMSPQGSAVTLGTL